MRPAANFCSSKQDQLIIVPAHARGFMIKPRCHKSHRAAMRGNGSLVHEMRAIPRLGEMLLFLLAERFLKVPQVLCKMDLKTDSRTRSMSRPAWSKGKTKHYAYYRCETRGCEAKSKSVPRSKMEEGFAEIMKALTPAESFFELAKDMMCDAWDNRFALAQGEKAALKDQLDDLDRQIESLLDRIVEASNASVVSAYENKIEKLERDKIVLKERLGNSVPEKGRFEDCMELALRFLSSPWKIYKNGDFAMRQTVLRLAFAEQLRYGKNGVYGTPELSFPFKYLGGISVKKSEMVPRARIELATRGFSILCSTTELPGHYKMWY